MDSAHGQTPVTGLQVNGRIGAAPSGQRQTKPVIIEIARPAEAPVKRSGRRLIPLAKEKQPGIERRAEIVVARMARVPRLEDLLNMTRNQSHFNFLLGRISRKKKYTEKIRTRKIP